jgi:hypothetical protein
MTTTPVADEFETMTDAEVDALMPELLRKIEREELAERRAAETAAAVAAAPDAIAAFWAQSASASVARDYRAGRVRTIRAR